MILFFNPYICRVKKYGTIKRLQVWLARIGNCRGFGIQSPWAYSFVRYVVNEHWPYYAFSSLRASFPNSSKVERKVGQFIFRLANFVQPSRTIAAFCDTDTEALLAAYTIAGCRRTDFVSCRNSEMLSAELKKRTADKPVILIIDTPSVEEKDLKERLIGEMRDGDFIILLDPKATPAARNVWQTICAMMPHGLTFDLYYLGVAYFDTKRYREHFKINF